MNREEILIWLGGNLRPKRVRHCLGVEQTAAALAHRWDCCEDKAALAGLVHDCAKGLSGADMAQRAARVGFAVEPLWAENPAILHAPAGADIARLELGIDDDEVLSAVFWHTIPHPEMTRLETIVWLADIIEPNRDFPGVDELRKLSRRNLDDAFRQGLAHGMASVLQGGWVLHPLSVTVYNGLVGAGKR